MKVLLNKQIFNYSFCALILTSCGNNKTNGAVTSAIVTKIDSTHTSTGDENNKHLKIFGLAQITVPNNFTALTTDEKAKKYPSNNAPQEVYANEDGTVSVAFTHTNQAFAEKDLDVYIKQTSDGIKQGIPNSKWYTAEVRNINEKKVGVLAFDSPAADGWIYNIMCFTVINNELIMYSFNCMVNQKSEWETKGKGIIESFKVSK